MATGRSQPSIVINVQVLVTHADRVATMAREMGNPPRLIRAPDVCYLFHARDDARLPGLVDRWESSGIAAQVVLIPPTGGRRLATVIPHHNSAKHGQAVRPATGETRMSAPTDHGTEGRDQTAPASPDARGPESIMDAPREMEVSFEEIER
jgi:hypothetical protein